ncbi:MAG: redoxin [Planctomycetota bacterium]
MASWILTVGVALAGSAPSPSDAADLAATPKILRPGDHGVGRRVVLPAWRDLEGDEGRFGPPAKGIVVAMTSSTCPLSRKYLPVLARLADTYEQRGVRFLLVAAAEPPLDNKTSLPGKAVDPLRELLAAVAPRLSCVRDKSPAIAQLVGAATTTDTVLIDAAGTVRYHGAVDDQYGLDYARDSARNRYLADALEAMLGGVRPAIEATAAPGCVLELNQETWRSPGPWTYHNRISRILQRNCVECHRTGGLAPFALETLEQVSAHKAMIQQVVQQQRMPPWFARESHGAARWLNDRSLSAADRDDLLAWLGHGLPEGDSADAPIPLAVPGEWKIGKPDLVVRLPKSVPIKAEGTMPYQHLVVETGLTDDRWVEAFEVRPTRREVVHHVLVFVLDGNGRRGGAEPDERSGFFAAYVPGNSSQVYPTGFAKKLPKGSRLLFQMHYTPNGQATEDRTELALRFTKDPPRHVVETVGIANTRIRIPPGASDHAEQASLRVPRDAIVLAFMPHMHLRGKAFRYEATRSDGQVEVLLDIPRYDFNWQLQYRLAEPYAATAGTTLQVTGWFDNSAGNPANPDPERTVRWGPQTFDEMLLGYIEYYVPGKPSSADASSREEPKNDSGNAASGSKAGRLKAGGLAAGGTDADDKPKTVGQRIAEAFRGVAVDSRFAKADANRDGRMTLDEARQAFNEVARYRNNPALLERHFRFLDADGDGVVTGQEFTRVSELGGR